MRSLLPLKNIAMFFLLLVCSFSAVAQTAVAPAAGNGTAGNPYQIATLENLYWITQNSSSWSSYFIQTANIDASVTNSWTEKFPPIANNTTNFSGSYNGQGYVIYGLSIRKSPDFYIGMFSNVSGTLTGVKLRSVIVYGYAYVGGIVGVLTGSISNSSVTGTVTGYGAALAVGGLVGKSQGNISNCYSDASVVTSDYYATYVGGLVGEFTFPATAKSISNCYATGSVTGKEKIGGLVGYIYSLSALDVNITNCYAVGAVTGTINVGGLVGSTYNGGATVTNSFWDTQTSGQATSAVSGTGSNTSAMKTQSTFSSAGWNFTSPWGMSSSINNGYPYLIGVTAIPSVTSMSPALNARNISASANINFTFNEPVSSATLVAGSSVLVFGSLSGKHTGSVTYTAGTFTASFDPTANFLPGEVVTVTVNSQVANSLGTKAIPAVWHFSVQSSSSDSLGTLVNVASITNAMFPAAADFDNDGDIDIATANYTSNSISVMLNTGSRSFAAPISYSLAADVRSINSGDVDNDGDIDLIASVNNSKISILKNNGNGTFAAAVNYTVGAWPIYSAVTDIDGDGDLDIASGNFSSGTISVITNNGSGVFSANTEYNVSTNDHGVYFSDIDGDKDMDMIASGYGGNYLGVFFNNGSGTFGSMTTYATGTNPVDVRAADIDGDGDEDLFNANAGGNSVSVLKNNGNGTFTAKTDYTVAAVPYNTIPCDVDGDGDIDIVVPSVNGATVTVLRNNGSGIFTAIAATMGFTVSGAATADMDGDGKMDAVLTSYSDNLVKVLYGGASSGKSLSFNATDGYGKVAIPAPTAYTIELWVKPADVTSRIIGSISDDNGPATSYNTHQIGITSDHKFQHYLYDGQLRFVTGTTTVVAGQWYHVAITASNNGQMRLFVNGVEEGTAVSIGTMFGSVNTYFFGMSSPQGSAYTGSMDNMRIWNYARTGSQISGSMFTAISGAQSGLLANYYCSEPTGAFAADSSGNNRTLNLKRSGYSWLAANAPVQPVVLSTMPAANALTVARTANITATFNTSMNAASFVSGSTVKVSGSKSGAHSGSITYSDATKVITFDPATNFSAGEAVEVTLTTGITSSDNFPQAAKKYYLLTVQSAAADTFAARVNYQTGSVPKCVTSADVDADGDVDLIASNGDSNTLSVLLNNGNGTFAAKADYATGDAPNSVTAADLDGDGDLDLATANYGSANISVLMNNGNGTFAAKADYTAGDSPICIVAIDADNDGDKDLMSTNYYSDTFSVLLNNGNGTFAAKTDYSTGSNPFSMTAADVDNDGDNDVIVTNSSSQNLSVRMNNGNGTFASPVNYATGDNPMSVTAADVDADGDVDLLTGNNTTNTLAVLMNNGNGTFAAKADYGTGFNGRSISTADVDGDGDLDVVAANNGGDDVTVLKNNGNGTFASNLNYGTGANPVSITAADLDGDGDMDCAVANSENDNLSVYLNTTYVALPVELVSFTAALRGTGVELLWSTATEVNNHGFEVERRAIENGKMTPQTTRDAEQRVMDNWSKAGFVEGNGNSNTAHEYSFTDRVLSAGKYIYRLKQIDRDGKFEYSKTVEVTVAAAPAKFSLEQNFPNPFNPSTTIGFTLQVSGMTTLKVYDAIGREVAMLANEYLEAGVYHQRTFDAATLPSGIYFARLQSDRSIQIRKMMLLK
ncbi:MAG: FG-GAP-like repeat-containing protein [Bacteroidota bacterium]